jgi:hypothetical protein
MMLGCENYVPATAEPASARTRADFMMNRWYVGMGVTAMSK